MLTVDYETLTAGHRLLTGELTAELTANLYLLTCNY